MAHESMAYLEWPQREVDWPGVVVRYPDNQLSTNSSDTPGSIHELWVVDCIHCDSGKFHLLSLHREGEELDADRCDVCPVAIMSNYDTAWRARNFAYYDMPAWIRDKKLIWDDAGE